MTPVHFHLKQHVQTPTRMRVRPRAGFTFTPLKTAAFYPPTRQPEMTMPSQVPAETIRLDDETDRWRFTCPNGHTTWEPTNHHFWCASCARQRDTEATFAALRDRRDGRRLAREDVCLRDRVGPFDRDLDAGGTSA